MARLPTQQVRNPIDNKSGTPSRATIIILVLLLLEISVLYTAPIQNSAFISYRSNAGINGLNFPTVMFWNSDGNGSWGSGIELPTAGSAVLYAVATNNIWSVENSLGQFEAITSAVLDTVANTLTVLDLNPANGYSLMQSVEFVPLTLFTVNITNATNLPRWESQNISTATAPTKGGNITGLPTMNGDLLTDEWAAFYGNITETIYLTGNTASIDSYLYRWQVDPYSVSGVICASTNSSLYSTYVTGANAVDIDQAWGFDAESMDSAANTFTGTNCSIDMSGMVINNSAFADTGATGGFKTCAIKTNEMAPITKSSLLFCSSVNSSGTAWNGQSANFEIMVPTIPGPGAETYYLYFSLN